MDLEIIQNRIYEIRGLRVMLDYDLAELYGVETRSLNQAVKRNQLRFPPDFMFQLSKDEAERSRSQFVILNERGSNIKYLPYAFTEHGVAMLASVLRSEKAIAVNIQIIRAFIALRQYMVESVQITKELEELRRQVNFIQEDMESLSKDHESYEQHFDDIYLALAELASANKYRNSKPHNKVGFVK